MNINGYTLQGELQNANSGFSKWGFALKNRREYFIKELITPVFPVDPGILTPEQFESRRASCYEYEQKFKKYYGRINDASRGNLVRIHEFFRHGSRYYIVTDRIYGLSVPMQQIAAMPEGKKLLLMKTVAQGFRDLHSAGIVHFDVKPNNILLQNTPSGNFTAKIIDFDAGFFSDEKLDERELGGDLTYLAPETFLGIIGEDVHPDDKADVFAVGLVFHEYYYGKLPEYSAKGYEYPYEAALEEGSILPDSEYGSRAVADLIWDMLQADPLKRPAMEDVLSRLNGLLGFEQSASDLLVRELEISYGGSQGKTISLTPERLRWWDNMSGVASAMEVPLQEEGYHSLMESVINAGLLGLMSAPKPAERLIISGSFGQTLEVCYRNGTRGTYSTRGTPLEAFTTIIGILEPHCMSSAASSVVTPPSATPVRMPEPTVTATTPPPAEWFSQAGDL